MKRLILIFVLLGIFYGSCFAMSESGKKPFGGSFDFSEWLMEYIRSERDTGLSVLYPREKAIVYVADALFSLLSLWLALFLVIRMQRVDIKKFLWIILGYNLFWYCFVFIIRLAWEILGYAFVRMSPSSFNMLQDYFTVFMLLGGVGMYIWMLARTFNLKFLGALSTVIVSHAIYFLIAAAAFKFIPAGSNETIRLLSNNLGPKAVLNGYVQDVNRISGFQWGLQLLRVRGFHI